MPPKSSKPNYLRWRENKFVIPKIAQRNGPSFFQEYFYFFLVGITLGVMLLLKGSGMKGTDAIVLGMWLGAILWFARQVQAYFRDKKKAAEPARAAKQPGPLASGEKEKWEPPKGMKPMIGPQWPLKSGTAGSESPKAPAEEEKEKEKENKPGFVYQRPTLPGRKPKLPANWSSQDKKKPKL
jgi:hypothetical protein